MGLFLYIVLPYLEPATERQGEQDLSTLRPCYIENCVGEPLVIMSKSLIQHLSAILFYKWLSSREWRGVVHQGDALYCLVQPRKLHVFLQWKEGRQYGASEAVLNKMTSVHQHPVLPFSSHVYSHSPKIPLGSRNLSSALVSCTCSRRADLWYPGSDNLYSWHLRNSQKHTPQAHFP